MTRGATFGGHLARLLLLLAPVGYVAQLLATAVHEFLGHGLVAIAVGGRFTGLSLAWDGMGWAAAHGPDPSTVAAEVSILVAGVASTCALGVAALAIAARLRNGPARWILLVVSGCSFLEGAPYLFWSAWHVDDRGDIGRIVLLLRATPDGHAEVWRAMFLVVGGVLTILGTVLPIGCLLRDLEASFPPDAEITRSRRAALALGFAVAGATFWWLFDWDQLLPGIGVLPPIAGGALIAATAVWYLVRGGSAPLVGAGVSPTSARTAAWWVAASACAAVTLLWLGDGVSWD